MNIDLTIKEFEKALLKINRLEATEIFDKCYLSENSTDALEVLTVNSLERIGEGWENGSISLAQVYMSGIICEELIEKYLSELPVKRKDGPKMAIAVLQDHHALGKRIVYSVLRAGGFELMDFGQGLNIDEVVKKTIENQIEILLISTLMLPSALKVNEVRKNLIEQGYKVKIIVGGAPFRLDSNLWKTVGAEADGKNASNIINVIETLIKGDK